MAISEETYRIRKAILSGKLAQNGRLMPERSLAAELKIPVNKIREILYQLTKEGLVYPHKGQGIFLTPPPGNAALRLGSQARRSSVEHLMEVRIALEPAVAASAAERASPAEKQGMLLAMEETLRATCIEEYEPSDDVFHFRLVEMANNPVFTTVYDEVRALRKRHDWHGARRHTLGQSELMKLGLQHNTIANAVCASDPTAAAEAMREHLYFVLALVNMQASHDAWRAQDIVIIDQED